MKLNVITIIFIFAAALLPAQTADELDAVLDSSAITYGQAAMFVIASAGSENIFSFDDSNEDLNSLTQKDFFDKAMELGWIRNGIAINDQITLGALSFLMMKAFDLKGGLMYALFPGQRYAFRSMVSKNIIQGTSDPGMKVSGGRFILILGNVLNFTEGEL